MAAAPDVGRHIADPSRRLCIGLVAASGIMLTGTVEAAVANPISELPLDGSPALAAGVVRRGRVLMTGGKGQAWLKSKAPPDSHTLFEIGSLTKTFTASLIFELQEEGRLNVNAPIGNYVTNLPEAWCALRLDQLLSHTAGVPNYLNADNFKSVLPRDLKPREIIALVANQPLAFVPGEQYEYSNTGFILLGMVAEAVTGSDYWDLLQERFFIPAEMTSTGPRNRIKSESRIAVGYFWDGNAFDNATPIAAPGSTWAAGGLISSVGDIDRWSLAIDKGRVLSGAVRRKMWQEAKFNNGRPAGWGYGWQIETVDGRLIVSHGGSTAGFSCWYRRDVSRSLSTIVCTNQNGRADPKAMTDILLRRL